MIVYHGSLFRVEEPEIIVTETGRDFGFGFYTTDIEDQAIRWARRKMFFAIKKYGRKIDAVLNIYEYDEISAKKNLNIKRFDNPSFEWLDFVINCRSNIKFLHNYDIVAGNIANDSVGETISFVMNGVMRKEDALERLKFQKINHQICFNTEKSLAHIKFIASMTV